MIVVDAGVWIDFFDGTESPAVDHLDAILGKSPIAMDARMLVEVLQGISRNADYQHAKALFRSVTLLTIAGHDIAIRSSDRIRLLRASGITLASTINGLTASYCIDTNHHLLYSHRDFDYYVQHFGLLKA